MTAPAGAAFTPYELLRTLIERVGWPTEDEKAAALRSVDEWERTAVFGNLVTALACEHHEDDRAPGGKCAGCGRQMENTAYPAGWSDRYRGARPQGIYGAGTGRGW